MKRYLMGLCGFIAAAACALLLLLSLLNTAGTAKPLMLQLMRTFAPPADTGLLETEYEPVVSGICDYLSGDKAELLNALDREGVTVPLFHSYELTHMEDCKGLFVLCRKVMLLCAAVLGVLAILMLLTGSVRTFFRGFRIGTVSISVLALVVIVWAAVDFNGLFILFHQLSFSNSLWLLNPATDLLIRLMPLQFFICNVVIILAAWAAALLMMFIGSSIVLRANKPAR